MRHYYFFTYKVSCHVIIAHFFQMLDIAAFLRAWTYWLMVGDSCEITADYSHASLLSKLDNATPKACKAHIGYL